MSIQFKTIRELREMLDKKVISSEELTSETHKLAEDLKDLNCFVTMNKDVSIEKSKLIDQADKSCFCLVRNSSGSKRFILH